MFISIYGINNIGKSTQVKLLHQKFVENGFTVKTIKYPIYDLAPTGPQIDYFLRNPDAPQITGPSFQMLYLQNRQDYEPELKRLLKEHQVVIAEDYIGTGIAWGMTQDAPLKWLEQIHRDHLTVFPDIEILMDGNRFLSGKEAGHRNEENDEQIEKCRQNFLFLAEKYGWKKVNANRDIAEVAKEIWTFVQRRK